MYRPIYKYQHTFIGTIIKDLDLYDSLTQIALDENILIGKITAIGAVQTAVIAYYDQITNQYQNIHLKDGYEILNCTGNISIRDGKPFVHAHITLGDKDGKTYGGHLMHGTKVFACEVFIDVFTGEDLVRLIDDKTNLFLWKHKDMI